MQRLRDQGSSSDPLTARAAELLSSMPPLDASRLRRRTLPPVEAASRGFAGRLGTTLVLAITLGTVAATAATIHRVGWPSGLFRSAQPPTATPQPVVAPPPAVRARPAPGPLAPAQPPTEHAVTREGDKIESPVTARPLIAPLPLRAAPSVATRAAAPTPTEDESALIVGAVRALRRDGDPVRAQSLAEEALRRYPNGMQVEEAMALAMEAAAARGDGAGSRRAAQRYLDSFRGGRFADRAQRILDAQPR